MTLFIWIIVGITLYQFAGLGLYVLLREELRRTIYHATGNPNQQRFYEAIAFMWCVYRWPKFLAIFVLSYWRSRA